MATTTTTTKGAEASRRGARPAPTPPEHLLRIRDSDPELIETRDFEEVARLAPHETLIQAAAQLFQMICNKTLGGAKRGARRASAEEREAERAEDATWATDKLRAFSFAIYDRLADLTRAQADKEIGVVQVILAGLGPRQRLRDVYTRDQFHARIMELSKRRSA